MEECSSSGRGMTLGLRFNVWLNVNVKVNLVNVSAWARKIFQVWKEQSDIASLSLCFPPAAELP